MRIIKTLMDSYRGNVLIQPAKDEKETIGLNIIEV